jgi:hypothetical protein
LPKALSLLRNHSAEDRSPGAGEIRDGALAARRLFRARSPISMARKKSARLHLAGAQSYRARTEDLRRAA